MRLLGRIVAGFPFCVIPVINLANRYLQKPVVLDEKYMNALKLYDEFLKHFETLGLEKFDFPDTLDELEKQAEKTWEEILQNPEDYCTWVRIKCLM